MRGGLRVAVTQGDPAGIGPEVVVKALAREELRDSAVVVASPRILARETQRTDLSLPRDLLEIPWPHKRLPTPGDGSAETGAHALECLKAAVSMACEGAVDGLVTAPVNKQMLKRAGAAYPGQTELIAELAGAEASLMMLVAGRLRVAVVTTHVPLVHVVSLLSRDTILEKLHILHAGLRQDFGVARPRIAVLSVNPHAGEGGCCGDEEEIHIKPATREAEKDGMAVEGPLPADGVFGTWEEGAWDAILAMYHDQGLAPFKALSFGRGVNVTLGLPFVRTSPDHGTAYDLAGKGVASEGSMVEAVRLALRVAQRRRRIAGKDGDR